MDTNDQARFKGLITSISDTYNKEFTPTELKLWWNMFKPHSIEAFEQSVYQHIACPDSGMFAPKPANIMKFITGTAKQNDQQLEDKADMEWLTITGEVKRVGSYGSLKMEDKQALAAVKSLGGWKFICSKTEAELVWLHKEFIATYKNFENTPVEALPDKLPGRVALENHKAEQSQGLKHITDSIQNYRNRKGIESK